MSRPDPTYRLHKASGQAFVQFKGKRHYLGKHDSPASRERYHAILAELHGQPDQVPQSLGAPGGALSVNELILAYVRHAESYYRSDGSRSNSLSNIRHAVRRLKELCGTTPSHQFGPIALDSIRQDMIGQGLSRKYINDTSDWIKRVFRWGVARELVPSSVYEALRALEGLKKNRSGAREPEPVRPVDPTDVEAVLAYVAPPVAAMIRIQQLTGVRSDNLTAMREADIDAAGDVWVFRPPKHKSEHRGCDMAIPLGPKVQAIIREFLSPDRKPNDYLFSPAEAKAWHNVQMRRARKTAVQPSQVDRRKQKPTRKPGQRYSTGTYRNAVKYGIARARNAGAPVKHWFPHQLRHSLGTEIRREYGLEEAQLLLGHSRCDVTQLYAEKNLKRAIEIAMERG